MPTSMIPNAVVSAIGLTLRQVHRQKECLRRVSPALETSAWGSGDGFRVNVKRQPHRWRLYSPSSASGNDDNITNEGKVYDVEINSSSRDENALEMYEIQVSTSSSASQHFSAKMTPSKSARSSSSDRETSLWTSTLTLRPSRVYDAEMSGDVTPSSSSSSSSSSPEPEKEYDSSCYSLTYCIERSTQRPVLHVGTPFLTSWSNFVDDEDLSSASPTSIATFRLDAPRDYSAIAAQVRTSEWESKSVTERRTPSFATGDAVIAPIRPGKRVVGYVYAHDPENSAGEGSASSIPVTSSLNGKVVKLLVEEGQDVAKGDPVVVVEAMKMETMIKAPADGKVVRCLVEAGSSVKLQESLVLIQPEPASPQ